MSTPRHKLLLATVQPLPTDYAPFGVAGRDGADYPGDCSCGCRHFAVLHVFKGTYATFTDYEGPDLDWGVCCNPKSPRRGLLTFEHQGGMGCFEAGTSPVAPEDDDD